MSKENSSNLLRGLICVAIGAIIWFIPAPAGVGPQAWGLLAVFVATIAGFILQPLPLGAIAIIACALLPVLGIMKAGQALEGFSNGTIWLIVSAFMFATGFIKTGLGKRIAYLLLSRFGKNTISSSLRSRHRTRLVAAASSTRSSTVSRRSSAVMPRRARTSARAHS